MRVNPAAFVGLHHRSSLGHQIEGGERQHQTQPRERRRVPHERAFQLNASGLVVQDVLLNGTAPAVLHKRVHAGGLITDDIPVLPVTGLVGSGEGHRAEGLGGNRHVVQEQRPAGGARAVLDFAGQVPAHWSQLKPSIADFPCAKRLPVPSPLVGEG